MLLLFDSLSFRTSWDADIKASLDDLNGSLEYLTSMMAVDDMDLRSLTTMVGFIRFLTLPQIKTALTAVANDLAKIGEGQRLDCLSIIVQAAVRRFRVAFLLSRPTGQRYTRLFSSW